jgi:hypothetical protein
MGQQVVGAAFIEQVPAAFLADWRGDAHRPLQDEHRERARRYISAILAHNRKDVRAGIPASEAYAATLWITFRDAYDGMSGQFKRSDAEDLQRALDRV